MSTASRSALRFLRRSGIRPTPRGTVPQFNPAGMVINHWPLCRDQLDPRLLLDAAGDPPPDRGATDAWPPPQEVIEIGPE